MKHPIYDLSIKTTVIVAVGLMGLVSLGLTFITSSIFGHLVENDRKHLLSHVLQKEFTNVSKKLALDLQDIAITISEDKRFSENLQNRTLLKEYLKEQFQRYFAEDGLVNMFSITVYDNNYQKLVTENNDMNGQACSRLIEKMMISEIPKRQTAVCSKQEYAVLASLVSVGGLKPKAFVQIESDLGKVLAVLENNLDIPLHGKILTTNKEFYRSEKAVIVAKSEYANYLINNNGEPVIRVSLITQVHALNRELNQKIFYIILSTIVITIVAIGLVLYVLGQNLVVPMKQLASHIQKVRNNRKFLAEKIQVEGNREIRELAQDFNAMTTELDSLYSSLQLMALTDPLTRLPNRLYLHDRLRDLMKCSLEQNKSFALCILDLDKFKEINDTYGHTVGDEFLRQFASRLKNNISLEMYCSERNDEVRKTMGDIFAARLGGDEFALLLPMVPDRAMVINLMTQFIGLVSEPMFITGYEYSVKPSIGVAIFPEDGSDYSQLFRCADMAMYLAKKSGIGVAGSHNREGGQQVI